MRRMKFFRLLGLIAFSAVLSLLSPSVYAFEPSVGVQWYDDNEPFHAKLYLRWYAAGNKPLQIMNVRTNHEENTKTYGFGVHLQYKIIPDISLFLGNHDFIPELLRRAKIECAADPFIVDGQDAYDAFRLTAECGLILGNGTGLRVGHSTEHNFGARNYGDNGWGVASSWVGLTVPLVHDWKGFTLAWYVNYYFSNNLPARITDTPLADKDISTLRVESGFQASYKIFPNLTIFAAPYANIGDAKYTAESIGVYPGLQWDFGEQLLKGKGFLEKLSLVVSGNYAVNIKNGWAVGNGRSEYEIWTQLVVDLSK